MNSNAKHIVKLVSLILFYMLLGTTGIYYMGTFILFPVLALPLTVCFIRNEISIKEHLLIHLIIVIGIYVITGTWLCLIVYLVSICIPTYAILYFYKQELPLPNIIMYVTLCLSVAVFIFFSIMKSVGVDFQAQVVETLNQMKNISIEEIQGWLTLQLQGVEISKAEISQLSFDLKELINVMANTLNTFFGALILIQILLSSSLLIIIFNCIVRRKDKKFPSIRQLLNFKLSKVAVLTLFLSLLIIDLGSSNVAISVLGANVMLFLMTLFQIVGVLALIGILSKALTRKGVKILGYVTVIILFSTLPYLVMFFGCLDAIFNYRKVEIVV